MIGELSKYLGDFTALGGESGLFAFFKQMRNENLAHSEDHSYDMLGGPSEFGNYCTLSR
jgi:hypothetical protein